VPYRPELTWLRVRDLVRELDPEILNEGDLSRRIKDVAVFAQGIPGGIRVLTEGRLVVVPGDRHEVVMAAYLAELSGTHLAALLLSAGIAPDPQVRELTRETSAAGLPVLVVEHDSYQTATRVRDLDPGLPADDLDRVEQVTDTVADALDPSWLRSLPSPSRPRRLSPAAFRYQLVELARAADALVVLPEGAEPRPCGPRSRAPTAASPAACCLAPRMRWPRRPGTSACGCPMTSPSWIRGPSPSATSPRWPSCGGTAAGPRRWPASISPTRSWSGP
jgi:phosphate acetyltransferase